jgi:anti-sigma regulatory factor (Ser/Thr protein kinase)
MKYEVCRAQIGAGETVLLTSDGIAESHDTHGEMFGLPRLVELIGEHPGGAALISAILEQLDRFRGSGGEQEDDVTMVTIRRTSSALESALAFGEDPNEVAAFSIPSNSGNERIVMERVANVAVGLGLGGEKLERLKTAVSEAAMNAIEHGNQGDPARLVNVAVLMSADRVLVRISDEGGATAMPEPELPDLDAKLAGMQSPRGWGLFLIEQMVDAVRHSTDGTQHTVELEMSRGAT